jgi:WhiB family redox-sensing transcriptional regulator
VAFSAAEAFDPTWRSRAACAGMPTDWFFPDAGEKLRAEAKAACASCPVRTACERYSYASGEKFGIWGGLSERERRRRRSLMRADDVVFRYATCEVCGGHFPLDDADSAKFCPGLCTVLGEIEYQRNYQRANVAEAG